MKSNIKILAIFLFSVFIFTSCNKDDDKAEGTMTLAITDAPVDNETIAKINLRISDVQYHTEGNAWASFEGYEGPQDFNILELTEGESAIMGSFSMDAGNYTQLRFILDAPEEGMSMTNPGCYIEFNDGTKEALFMPSGAQTGWKATGNFSVPSNGSVAVTADFDARKSIVHETGSGKYMMKPTIRLIVDNQAGSIRGTVVNMPADESLLLYAYEDGTYSESETEAATDTTVRFPNAETSTKVNADGTYTLAFLAPGTYDLVITAAVDGEFSQVLGIIEDVEVQSESNTETDIDIDIL